MTKCCECDKALDKDEVGISKKLLGRDSRELFCLDCLAEYLDVTTDDLLEKIEQFKEEGCTLFG